VHGFSELKEITTFIRTIYSLLVMFSFWKRLGRAEKVELAVSFFIRISILVALVGAIISFNWTIVFVSALTLLLVFLPSIIERNFKFHLPAEFEILVVTFIYASLVLGEVYGYYTRFWWWDLVLHMGSGVALGFIGFLTLYLLYDEKKIKAKPITIAIFSFSFALAIGAIWEMFEFSMDSLFGFAMQKGGLVDTMWDLIVDAGGALFASTLGFIYIKTGEMRLFGGMVRKFIEENPKFFGKRLKTR